MRILVKNLTDLPLSIDFPSDDETCVRELIPVGGEVDVGQRVTPWEANRDFLIRSLVTPQDGPVTYTPMPALHPRAYTCSAAGGVATITFVPEDHDLVTLDTPWGGAVPGVPTVTVKSEVTPAGIGVAGTFLHSDAQIQAATAAPVTIGAANAQGASSSLARADHVHDHGNLLGGSLHAVVGVAAGFMSPADALSLATFALPTVSVKSEATPTSTGAATTFLRTDAQIQAATATPVSVGAANAQGASSALARADHVHDHGNLLGGTTHAVAVPGVSNGFLSAAGATLLANPWMRVFLLRGR